MVKDGLVSLTYRNNIYRPRTQPLKRARKIISARGSPDWSESGTGSPWSTASPSGISSFPRILPNRWQEGRYTYRFNPRTSIFGEYAFDTVNFEKPGVDYYVQTPSLGIEYAFSPTLRGTVQFGWFWQSPREGSGQNSPFYNVGPFSAGAKGNLWPPVSGGLPSGPFQLLKSRVHPVPQGRRIGELSNHRRDNGKPFRKLRKRQIWNRSEWPFAGGEPEENIWNVSGGLGYQMLRWLNLSLSLTYRADDSNVPNRDYNEVRGMIRAEATYK